MKKAKKDRPVVLRLTIDEAIALADGIAFAVACPHHQSAFGNTARVTDPDRLLRATVALAKLREALTAWRARR